MQNQGPWIRSFGSHGPYWPESYDRWHRRNYRNVRCRIWRNRPINLKLTMIKFDYILNNIPVYYVIVNLWNMYHKFSVSLIISCLVRMPNFSWAIRFFFQVALERILQRKGFDFVLKFISKPSQPLSREICWETRISKRVAMTQVIDSLVIVYWKQSNN